MTNARPYVLEDTPAGRSLVVTGAWSDAAARTLARGEADGLVLNYARGFSDHSLELLEPSWALRRLNVLDRSITDLAPLGRLSESLEELSIQAAPKAELDLGLLPRLRKVAGEWSLIGATLNDLHEVQEVHTWVFDDADLHAFRDHAELRHLTVKDARNLESLDGVGDLPDLETLKVLLARALHDISAVTGLGATLRHFELQDCPLIDTLDEIEPLRNLRFLGVSECGSIESFAPLAGLLKLETLAAWGTTRVIDGDLTPVARLPRLSGLKMRDRREYRPRVAELVERVSRSGAA